MIQDYIDQSASEYSESFIRDSGITEPKKIEQVTNLMFIQDYCLSEAVEIVKTLPP